MQRHYLEVALSGAINENNPGDVTLLIEGVAESSKTSHPNKANLAARDEQGRTFLHHALECGAYDAFNILFPYYQYDSELLLSCDNKDRSLFWLAIARGKKNIAEKLLPYYKKSEAAPPPLARDTWLKADNEGVTPLHWAAQSEDATLLPSLIDNLNKQDNIIDLVNSFDKNLNTLLHHACQKKRRPQIILLLQLGASTVLNNNNGESFISYLEQDPSLFSASELNIKIKRRILLQIHYQQIADPDNEGLKKLLAQLTSQTSLLDVVKHNINQFFELEEPLDSVTRELLGSGVNPHQEAIYQQIYQDRLRLKTYCKKIAEHHDKLSKLDEDVLPAKSGPGIVAITLVVIGFILAFSSVGAIISPIAMLIIFITSGVCFLSSVGIFMHASYKRYQLVHGETYSLMPDAKEILGKLTAVEKKDPSVLPVNSKTLRELEAAITALEPNDKKKRAIFIEKVIFGKFFNRDHELILPKLTKLTGSLEEIAKAIVIKSKPLPAVDAVPVIAPKLTAATVSIIEMAEALRALPRVSQFTQGFFTADDRSCEETVLFVDNDEVEVGSRWGQVPD